MKNKIYQTKRRVKKQQPSKRNAQTEGNFFEAQVQKKCEKCSDKEEQKVQKKSNGESAANSKSGFTSFMGNIQSKGQNLAKSQRSFFENRMSDNFSDVKIHRDKEASNAAKEIGAKAFAYKNHVVLNQDTIKKGSVEEKQILAHELKHVQQQKGGGFKVQKMADEQSETGKMNAGNSASAMMEKEAAIAEDEIVMPESVPDFHTQGIPTFKTVKGTSVNFEGETTAAFDGGTGTAEGLTRTPSEDCTGCAEGDCYTYTGQFVINYSVTTNVTLPPVPEGLSACQEERVRSAINGELAAHEQDHVTAFDTYNGTVTLPINYTGCSAGIQDYALELHHADAAAREARVSAASAALDPFHVSVDLDCEDAPAPVPPAEGEE